MPPDPGNAPIDRRLESWKEIAAHFRRDVRTVQRWEKLEGLPVHRLQHQQRGAVYALTSELDAWWRARSDSAQTRDSRSSWRMRLALGAAVICLLATGTALYLHRVPTIARVDMLDNRLVARSAEGQEIWTADLPEGSGTVISATRPNTRPFAIADVDADGREDVVVSIRSALHGGGDDVDTLYLFDNTGRMRWAKRLDERVRFRSGEYGPPWRTTDLMVFRGAAGPRIVWTVQHDVWWPSMLLFLDGAGIVQQRFVHAGWLGRVEITRDGRQLVVAGVSNEHDGSVLAALDAARIDGHSPGDPESRYACLDCSNGLPTSYLLLPRSEGTADAPLDTLLPGFQIMPSGAVLVRIDHDGAEGGSESIYEISKQFTLMRASFSDAYWQRHRQLEVAGTVAHDAPSCPEQDGPPVLEFVPASRTWTRLKPQMNAASQASNTR